MDLPTEGTAFPAPRVEQSVATGSGMPLASHGSYHWMEHPNHVAVLGEGIALPLVHTAWITALAFTVANLGLLRRRIRVEDATLGRRAA